MAWEGAFPRWRYHRRTVQQLFLLAERYSNEPNCCCSQSRRRSRTMTGAGGNDAHGFSGDNRRAGYDRRLERRDLAERRMGADRRDDHRHPYHPEGQRRGTDRPEDLVRRATVDRRVSDDRRAVQ